MPLTAAAAAATITPAPGALGSSAATSASAGPSGSANALGGMGSEAFMQLLVAQMRYQNPMEPQDSSQYLAQISQYAMVEQLQKVAQGQQEIRDYQRATAANNMIGKVVAGIGETGNPVAGEVVGVIFQAGKPVLVTTAGEIALDRVDEARVPTQAVATAKATATTPTNSSTPGTSGPTES